MQILDGVPLSSLTTLRVGGPARHLWRPTDEAEMIEAIDTNEDVLVIAGGSNVLIGDDGFDGRTVQLDSRGIDIKTSHDSVILTVQAGHPWAELVSLCVQESFAGLECLSGIPGSTGATPVQNVGAYGQEVASLITGVRVWDRRTRNVREIPGNECGFTYRNSIFKRNHRYVISAVTFSLPRTTMSVPIRYGELARALGVEAGARAPLHDVHRNVLDLRKGKGMVLDEFDSDTYSAGSFFTNPILDAEAFSALRERAHLGEPPMWDQPDGSIKTSAAWLLDRAGYGKGYGTGRARLSTKHSLALTNHDHASAMDIVELAREIRNGVFKRFGVLLEPEPVFVGIEL